MTVECIDAHHHLWKYDDVDYGWMSDEMTVLKKDYVLAELHAATVSAQVTGTVVVQARQSLEETEWLLELAEQDSLIRGVVGWVPLIDPAVGDVLARYVGRPLKSVRHVLHDEADDDYMLRADFNRGIKELKGYELAYDILIFEKHLPQALEFVDRHPGQVFVVDHIAKPKIKAQEMEPWRARMRELAQRKNVYCKLSGVLTEAAWTSWSKADVLPYMEAVLEIFGPKRLMFGSDWPVLNVASDYAGWAGMVRRLIAGLSAEEQMRIMAGTAIEAYKLS